MTAMSTSRSSQLGDILVVLLSAILSLIVLMLHNIHLLCERAANNVGQLADRLGENQSRDASDNVEGDKRRDILPDVRGEVSSSELNLQRSVPGDFAARLSRPNFRHAVCRYYAVAVGRRTGIFRSWEEAEPLVRGFPGNVHQMFRSRDRAEEYLRYHGVAFVHEDSD